MRINSIVLSLAHLFFILFIFSFSLICLCISLFDDFNKIILEIIATRLDIFLYLGMLGMVFCMVFILSFSFLHKRQYIKVKMNDIASFSISPVVIQKYIEEYWKKAFPEKEILSKVYVKKDQLLDIDVYFPFVKEDKKKLLLQMEKEISKILEKRCTYSKEFTLNLHHY